jgi:hypothetical protein
VTDADQPNQSDQAHSPGEPAGASVRSANTEAKPRALGKRQPPIPRPPKPPVAWRPQSRASRTGHTKKMFVAVAIALFVAGWVLVAFSRIANRSPQKVQLGSRVFDLGNATSRAKSIARSGPLFFNDLVDDKRALPVAINVIGDPIENDSWFVLNPIPIGSDITCAVRWDSNKSFTDPCTGEIYAPNGQTKDGKKLQRFFVQVNDKGRLVANLNKPFVSTPKKPKPAVTAAP